MDTGCRPEDIPRLMAERDEWQNESKNYFLSVGLDDDGDDDKKNAIFSNLKKIFFEFLKNLLQGF